MPCEVLAENRVASEGRRGDEQRNERRGKNLRRHLHHAPDAADLGGRVKGGANLVVNMTRFEFLEREQGGFEFPLHRGGSE